ncbi:serine/threonine protein kinase [Variovorax sp. J2P1-59]|uniref:serine/threonine protein kinase n=1 Tax=Variovorax flavidus TaxID=3053501 RepID=UPI0025775D77|nr:serine/threonine protein kinase [Variovorax sp. J2P1-59]MDM0078071.1 serine/threonine protein kinase [Variovorax sp. J2P1-59]
MKQGKIFTTVALVGMLSLSSGVLAQTTAQPAAPDPAKGGQASTKTPAGVANPTQRPDGSNPASREEVKSEARSENRSPANTKVPKGEPSTMTNNQPNAPQRTGAMSRAEVKPSKDELKPQAGVKGERPDVPTNPKEKTGTPQ